MTTLLGQQAAHREYVNRPPDERYSSVDAMITAAQAQRDHSAEKEYSIKDLRVVPSSIGPETADQYVKLVSPKGSARFSHWSFGQFSRIVGAPASYLRDLPPPLAADCLNYGIKETPFGTRINLLAQAKAAGDPDPIIRAATSDTYSRVWDSELYSAVQQQITSKDDKWTLPTAWSGEKTGAYRGDRDSFLILVNGGSIVTDPTLTRSGASLTPSIGPNKGGGPSDGMYRGIMLRNSEVGASSIVIETILFRYICGNLLLWGAVMDRQFRRRHVGTRIVREAMREISTFAFNYVRQSEDRDKAIIARLVSSELAHTKDAIIDELRKMGATKEVAEAAYATTERTETASPRSYWGLAQGLTRLSQESAWQDERFLTDQLAAKVLSRGAKHLVAA